MASQTESCSGRRRLAGTGDVEGLWRRRRPLLHDKRRGFSLVELLVIIGIILLLLGLLLAAIGRARRGSRAVQCANNLRQLTSAALAYAQDNGGMFPLAHYLDKNGTPPNSVTGAPVLLKPYYKTEDVIVCQEGPQAIDLLKIYGALWPPGAGMPQYTSYQYNFYIFPNGLPPNQRAQPTNANRLKNGAELIILYDGGVSLDHLGPWEVVQARHPGPSWNAAYMDGHVETLSARAVGTAKGVDGAIPAYVVDRPGRRPIYYAGAEDIPNRGKGESQGLAGPPDSAGFGAIVWGLVEWRPENP